MQLRCIYILCTLELLALRTYVQTAVAVPVAVGHLYEHTQEAFLQGMHNELVW
jgi:hypothetical protein